MERPIAILASDVGGLRVMTALARRAPAEDFIYLADTGRGPYGGCPVAQVRRWTEECAYYLLRFDPKVLVVACYTMGAVAGEYLRKRLPVPVFLAPGLLCQRAAAEETEGPVALLASETALATGFYRSVLGGARVICCPATELIEALEGRAAGPESDIRVLLKRALTPAREADAGAVLLGDVSLGEVAPLVGEVLGSGVRVVDVVGELVEEVEHMLAMTVLSRPRGGDGGRYVFVSGDAEDFRERGARVYGEPLGRVDVASPERFFQQMATLREG